ncbi:hypothetical protein SLS62_005254 [Diatrype stigma]|uniref:Uncharacterized protein n=1 Tax=Diatrype stigma TaxID=117547 RepID=A0AAN9YS95_9PEZI
MSHERRTSTSLEAPERKGVNDPGAHELDFQDSVAYRLAAESDSDDQFTDAQSEIPGRSPGSTSPIPRTRVERVDDAPAHGEVPGTEAYNKRTEDATPDEIAFVPETISSQSTGRSLSPGGHPIPKTVVDETEDIPGSTTHHYHEQLHQADATPDMVHKADGTGEVNPVPSSAGTSKEGSGDTPETPTLSSTVPRQRRKSAVEAGDDHNHDDNDDDFGDDFDDFEEGGEGDDDDFGDFDDGFQQAEADTPAPVSTTQPQAPIPSFPILDLDGLDLEDILTATEPYLNALYSPEILELPPLPSPPKDNPIFFNPRSASLWSQLAAPPPLQPPDWIRSPIRRLFLVSLGVPVDLDEILPASKQKKLVLPSLHRISSNGSFRTSGSRSVSRLRKTDGNDSSVSVDSQGKLKPESASRRKRGAPEAPELDLVSAKQLCTTTKEALGGMTDAELRAHVKKLEELEVLAKEVLEFWKKRTDEKIGDREAFEGVIENLVKHARKTRK